MGVALLYLKCNAAYTTMNNRTEPTMPPDNIISTGELMNRNMQNHKVGKIHANQPISFFLAVLSKKFIQPSWPNISEYNLVQAASDAKRLEYNTKKAPIR